MPSPFALPRGGTRVDGGWHPALCTRASHSDEAWGCFEFGAEVSGRLDELRRLDPTWVHSSRFARAAASRLPEQSG